MKWKNPHPEKKVKSLEFSRAGKLEVGAPALFAISTGTKK